MPKSKKRNRDWTALEEKFSQLLHDMMEQSPDFYEPSTKETDYSFLDRDTKPKKAAKKFNLEIGILGNPDFCGACEIGRGNVCFNGSAISEVRYRSPLRIATLVTCVLLTSSCMAVWINSEPANAMKFHIEKEFYQMKEGGFSTVGQHTAGLDQEESIKVNIDRMEDLDQARRIMPEILVPGYIPEGYVLESLTIEEYINGNHWAFYRFGSKENKMYVNIFSGENESQNERLSKERLLTSEEKDLYRGGEPSRENKSSRFMINGMSVNILGMFSEAEILEIAKGLY